MRSSYCRISKPLLQFTHFPQKMFFIRRYLPLDRSEPESATDSQETNSRAPAPGSRPAAEIELGPIGRPVDSSSPQVIRSRVVTVSYPTDVQEDEFQDFELDESPSPAAVAAVRVCVWALFLFGFLMLFHNQQEKFMMERARQTGRLRSSQLIHLPIAWADSSDGSSIALPFESHFIASGDVFSLQRHMAGSRSVLTRRDGLSPIAFDSKETQSGNFVATQHVQGEVLKLVKSDNTNEYSFESNGKQVSLKSKDDIVFFHHIVSLGHSLVVSRPTSSNTSDCILKFEANKCTKASPVSRGDAYFYDEETQTIVSVGPDRLTTDSAGISLRGIFVQSVNPKDGAVGVSISIPFLNRYDEGMWVFQTPPLTNGYIVILPVMGFPPTPVQHVVTLRDLSDGLRAGSVLRMENLNLRLFRKIDALKYLQNVKSSSCSC